MSGTLCVPNLRVERHKLPPVERLISLVVAMDRARLIGRDGALPWRLPNDMKHFKAVTLGKTVLMGRKTWDSLFVRPLPQRENWVLTRDLHFAASGARVFHDLDSALKSHREGELAVIGGAELYAQVMPIAQRIHLTEVDAQLEGDAWLEPLEPGQWREVARASHPADERHAHPYSFVTLERLP